MQGKTVLITGANAGIGKVTALELAKAGAHVVAVARDQRKGERAAAEVQERSGNPNVDLLLADLASLDKVRDLARQFLDRYPRLDVLIHNAGLMQSQRSETVDGHETTLAVNHLAPFLLTHLLWQRLKESAPSRVVTVASRAHRRVTPEHLADLESRQEYQGFLVYSMTKLANVLFTRELARRLEGSGVTANCLHPGVVRTDFGADGDARGWFAWAIRLTRPFFLSPEEGAKTTVYLASSPSVAEVSGYYFDRCKKAATSSLGADMAAARELWRKSAELTGVDPEAIPGG